LIASMSLPMAAEAEPVSDEVRAAGALWSVPRFTMLDLARSSDGTIFILSEDGKKNKSLLVGASVAGPGRSLPLADRSMPESNFRLIDGGDTLWLGGTKNFRRSVSGSSLSDGYLAKIDREGHVVWDLEIARSRENAILDLAALSSGDVIVTGREDDRNWLARISQDGRISWEKTIGLGKISSVAVIGEEIIVAAFEASNAANAGRDQAQVAIWRFSGTGQLLGHQIVRDDVARNPSSLWLIKAAVGHDAIYVFSAWTESTQNSRSSKPLGVVKMDKQGRVLWKTEIADTVIPTRLGLQLCVRGVVTLVDGSVLVDCAVEGGIKFFRLDANTGEVAQLFLPNLQRSNCDGVLGWSSFMVQRAQTIAWIFGNGAGCTWLQQLSLGDFRK
jgi:hypothetical protein